jgi:hypothetical protein
MSAASGAAASAQPSGHGPVIGAGRSVPAPARQLATQLSALFDRDVEIVKRLNDADHRLQDAGERLWSGLAPDAFGLIYHDAGGAAVGTSPIAKLIRDGGPTANSLILEALKQARWQIHHGFCQYQSACEERRQLAFEVGELSQQLAQALCAAGWSADQARHANVHELARATT